MKLNKLFLGILGAAAMTLASCSDDDKYEWASVSGPQVFFSDELPAQFEISPDATSFNVPISRVDASGALTVNLTSETAGTMYSIPSSVSFDAGEKTANIAVSYDPANIEYGRYDDLKITIEDASATPWGTQEFTFKAGVTDWGPWQKWNSAGTATYVYVNFWSGDDVGLPFVYRHNMIKTNLYQFKLSNWGYGVDIVFDYDDETGHVTVEKQWTGYDHSSYGYVYAMDYNAYRASRGAVAIEEGYGTFDQEQGIFTVPVAYVVDAGSFGYDPEYIYIDGYVRADYTSEVEYAGIFTDVAGGAYAVGTLLAGADVTSAQAIVLDADADAAAVADAIAAGELEATEVEPGTIYVPIPEDLSGKLQIVVAVIVDGEVKSVSASPFEYYGGAPSPWESIGFGYYTDDFVVPLYTEAGEPYTYEVEIEANKDVPGLYRIVNCYQGVAEAFGETGGKRSIEIHAEDPDGVYFLLQSVGLDFGDGDIAIVSVGGRYVAANGFDVVKEKAPQYLGKLADGEMTFPSFAYNDEGSTYQGVIYLGDSGYYGGTNGAVKLVLPDAAASVRAQARNRAKASDFAIRLNGGKSANLKAKKYVRSLVPNK